MLPYLAQVAAASPTAGAEALSLVSRAPGFLDALLNNWPITVTLVALVYFFGRLTESVKMLGESVKEMVLRLDKRLDSHSETLDDHTNRLAATEAITGSLAKKAGLG